MAEWRELCLHQDVERLILARLNSCGLSARMLAGVQREIVSRKETGVGLLGEVAMEFIKKSGFEVQLKNLVYHTLSQLHHRQQTLPLLPTSLMVAEPLDFMRLAQEVWEGRIRRGVNTLVTEIGAPLSKEVIYQLLYCGTPLTLIPLGEKRVRSDAEKQWIRRRWNGLGADFPVSKDLHSIYSPNNLMDVLVTVSSPNAVWNEDTSGMKCGLMKVRLDHKSPFDLRAVYSVLSVTGQQVETALKDRGEAAYIEKATKVIEMGLHPLAREMCKRGCPVTCRRELWSSAISLDTKHEKHAFHFEKLKSSVFHTHLFLEKLLVKEVKETTANDDNYFVFEDTILQVLFAFLHDYSILNQLQHINITPMKAHIPGPTDDTHIDVVYPPNGIIPFHGFSFLVAPLCYILDRPDRVYAMFKRLYLRYFIHLHCISSHPQGIVQLCCLFESLLHSRLPDLFQHLTAIEAPPLQLVFNWLMTAFASHLDCRQLLLLWDRVIGFDSLDIVAVFAVAVLEFRAVNLFKATCLSEAEAIVSDLRCLKVLPLLHQTLFL